MKTSYKLQYLISKYFYQNYIFLLFYLYYLKIYFYLAVDFLLFKPFSS